jgi:hypothetical protein
MHAGDNGVQVHYAPLHNMCELHACTFSVERPPKTLTEPKINTNGVALLLLSGLDPTTPIPGL